MERIISSTKRGFGKVWAIIIILVVLGVGAYIWERSYVHTADFDYPSLQAPIPNLDTTNWKTYSNPDYSIEYPHDWSLDSSKATPNNEYEGSIVTLSKENHKVEIYIPSASSPSICLFEGDPQYMTGGEASTVKIAGDYIEVQSSLNTFRRSVDPKPIDGQTNEKRFIICQKYKDSNFFHTSNNVSFVVPVNYNKDLVSEMDEILKRFRDK